MSSYPTAKTVNLATFPLQRESAVKIKPTAAPNLREGNLLMDITLHQSPSGAKFIQTETERKSTVLEVKGLGFVYQSAAHSSFERDDRIQSGYGVVEDVAT